MYPAVALYDTDLTMQLSELLSLDANMIAVESLAEPSTTEPFVIVPYSNMDSDFRSIPLPA